MPADDVLINGVIPGAGRCAIKDCKIDAARGQLMCRRHWAKVDLHAAAALQQEMRRWLHGGGTLGDLREAQRACVESVTP